MRTPIAFLLAGSVVLASCGGWRDSRVNPRNWFGQSQPVAAEASSGEVNPLIPRKTGPGLFSRPEAEDTSVLISSVTGMRIERTPSGAIIYAEGLASRLGAHDVELRQSDTAEAGTLEYEFRAVYPVRPTAVGSEFSRTLRAAASVSAQDLSGVSLIRVKAAANARESRRR
ncbi:hypothetical protein ACUXV3_03420 [Roseobacteraceae bacterium NS-SX3]